MTPSSPRPENIYIVTRGHNYEGDSNVWAGIDKDEAFRIADATPHGDDVTVVRMAPDEQEMWSRPGWSDERPPILAYQHRSAATGWNTVTAIVERS